MAAKTALPTYHLVGQTTYKLTYHQPGTNSSPASFDENTRGTYFSNTTLKNLNITVSCQEVNNNNIANNTNNNNNTNNKNNNNNNYNNYNTLPRSTGLLKYKMNSQTSNEMHIIPIVGHKQRSKSIGNFTSILVNDRCRDNICDVFSQQPKSILVNDRCRNSSDRDNISEVFSQQPLPDRIPGQFEKLEENRVPPNGEVAQPLPSVTSITSKVSRTASASTKGGNTSSNSRENRFIVSHSTISKSNNNNNNNTNIKNNNNNNTNSNNNNPQSRCETLITESWKDDSLSLCSSFSSSMSSLPSIPSPPSPATPPSYRPQSVPQTAEVSPADTSLSCSLPEPPAFLTTYDTTACGGAPRKRLKDSEGFIRRAACLCLNADETQVLLVSSKSNDSVWLVPGGGLEEGEEAAAAAIREAYEEAGVRGTILSYLGLFESRPDANSSGKKHRTAVYIVRVTKEEEEFPEARTLGRQRKWMTVDDAFAHLSRHRPRQSVYLQLLRANRLTLKD